jgi:hypothetical protein
MRSPTSEYSIVPWTGDAPAIVLCSIHLHVALTTQRGHFALKMWNTTTTKTTFLINQADKINQSSRQK